LTSRWWSGASSACPWLVTPDERNIDAAAAVAAAAADDDDEDED